jgi:hypothetical protein
LYSTLKLCSAPVLVVAEVNLRFIWDVVSEMKVGERGIAYVVDADGRLIAHPDISLVLRNTDLSQLPQVKAARAGGGGNSIPGRGCRQQPRRQTRFKHLQRIPVKLTRSRRGGISCGILHEKVSVQKHRRVGIEYEWSARKTFADRL